MAKFNKCSLNWNFSIADCNEDDVPSFEPGVMDYLCFAYCEDDHEAEMSTIIGFCQFKWPRNDPENFFDGYCYKQKRGVGVEDTIRKIQLRYAGFVEYGARPLTPLVRQIHLKRAGSSNGRQKSLVKYFADDSSSDDGQATTTFTDVTGTGGSSSGTESTHDESIVETPTKKIKLEPYSTAFTP